MDASKQAERETLLADVIIHAVEGGIDYWARAKNYRWWMDVLGASHPGEPDALGPSPHGGDNARVTIVEYGDEGEPLGELELTPVMVAGVFKRLARWQRGEGPEANVSEVWRDHVLAQYRANDHDFDARDADMLVQLAVLGEVRYG